MVPVLAERDSTLTAGTVLWKPLPECDRLLPRAESGGSTATDPELNSTGPSAGERCFGGG